MHIIIHASKALQSQHIQSAFTVNRIVRLLGLFTRDVQADLDQDSSRLTIIHL